MHEYKGQQFAIVPSGDRFSVQFVDSVMVETFDSAEQALEATKRGIDRTLAEVEIDNILADWMESGAITADQYGQAWQMISAL